MSGDLAYTVSIEEMKKLLAAEFARDPLLLDEVHQLIIDNRIVGKPGALFRYLFIGTTSETEGTIYPVVGFRLRDSDERLAALAAFDAEKAIAPVHSEASVTNRIPVAEDQ